MKIEPGQRVTLRGRVERIDELIYSTESLYDLSCRWFAREMLASTKRLTVVLEGTGVERLSVNVPDGAVELEEEKKPEAPEAKVSAGLVLPDELYAAVLRCGFLDPEQVPKLWRGRAQKLVRQMEEEDTSNQL